MTNFKADDKDDGASSIVVVDVPEGISIQLAEVGNEGNYISVILIDQQIDELIAWLSARRQPKSAPAPKDLPKVAMFQIKTLEESAVMQFALTCAVAIICNNPDRASNAAQGVHHHSGHDPENVAQLSMRLDRLAKAVWGKSIGGVSV